MNFYNNHLKTFFAVMIIWLGGVRDLPAQKHPIGLKQASTEEQPTSVDSVNEQPGVYDEAYFRLKELNAGLPIDWLEGLDRETPQATLEAFVDACRNGDYWRAAGTMNLNGIEPAEQAELGPELAEQLKFLMDQKVWIQWDRVPDRADGEEFGYTFEKQTQSGSEGPKRAISLGAGHVGRPRRGILPATYETRWPGTGLGFRAANG